MRPRLFARERLRWRAIALCVVGYCLVLVAWSAPGPSPDDAPQPEFGIKAAFLYKFLSYVEWRPGTFKEAGAPVVIGVVGAKDVADSLRALTEGRAVGDRPVEVRELQSTDSLNNVHLLFVGHAASSRIPALVWQQIEGQFMVAYVPERAGDGRSTRPVRALSAYVTRGDIDVRTPPKLFVPIVSPRTAPSGVHLRRQ